MNEVNRATGRAYNGKRGPLILAFIFAAGLVLIGIAEYIQG